MTRTLEQILATEKPEIVANAKKVAAEILLEVDHQKSKALDFSSAETTSLILEDGVEYQRRQRDEW